MGIRVGIIAREEEDAAWEVAHQRFPADRKGQLLHEMAMKVSDSSWHKQLSRLGAESEETPSAYWLKPFEMSKTNCPYLVGNYATVSSELARYLAAGFATFILDIPPDRDELRHIGIVFERALAIGGAGAQA
jgi:alkanesulfonate monooxygenase